MNYWMRSHPELKSVLGGSYESDVDDDGVSKTTMKLVIRIQKLSDFGIYKCVAKNAWGTTEETIKILRKFFFSSFLSRKSLFDTFEF